MCLYTHRTVTQNGINSDESTYRSRLHQFGGEVAVPFKIEAMFSPEKDAIGMAQAFARLDKADGSGVGHPSERAASGL